MTKRGWVVLGLIGVFLAALTLAGIGAVGYFLYQHKKSADTAAEAHRLTASGTVAPPQVLDNTWELDSTYNSATGTMLRWYSVKDAGNQYDITIFNDGSISLTRLDAHAPAITCTDAEIDIGTCAVVIRFDDDVAETQNIQPVADGYAGAAHFVNSKEILPKLAVSNKVAIAFTNKDDTTKVLEFRTSNCPVHIQ